MYLAAVVKMKNKKKQREKSVNINMFLHSTVYV
jgi:hypothetical protein